MRSADYPIRHVVTDALLALRGETDKRLRIHPDDVAELGAEMDAAGGLGEPPVFMGWTLVPDDGVSRLARQ